MSATLTYVYCLVRAATPPPLRRVPGPVPGARSVRLVEVPGVAGRAPRLGRKPESQRPTSRHRAWLVVSSVPTRQYDEAALARELKREGWVIPRALAHEAVVEHFLTLPAVLPMQLFTLFSSDERAIEHMARNRARIARILARIEGRVEWGLRVSVEGRTLETTRLEDAKRSREQPPSGTAYLAMKRDLRGTARQQLDRARRAAERVYRTIRRTADAARRRTEVERAAPGSRVVLDAAFLVPTARGRAFQAFVVRQVRPLQQAGMIVSVTGPWPAYNFL